jgi:hypothetical protein
MLFVIYHTQLHSIYTCLDKAAISSCPAPTKGHRKFSKLLLGEDMSGTGKASSALALSNAITNIAGKITSFLTDPQFSEYLPLVSPDHILFFQLP